ncbi:MULTISPECIES: ABC transporter permease [Brevibacillus]|jgi:ABC-type proline/glycine betaine transport system permease subunit|uniref:Glycine betaine/proline transport system permease protein n=1 Tax=Brevibacillus centrosporus TaxID=54910 RepID=A0A1I4ALK7_9BACL|nr:MULTISPECIES: proline/glycine betaine ABC transporter permease [Brevibacillus]MDR7315589.1 ABC-type proline/glycine betaine transport system permease subunit [Brevibacillus nitrificans]MEC2128005.1 proline/glycine betaine ABC transporter permease [Brevibacillus centrosporus]MED4910690.1 proline/glycine betaine ABC transporter permease [Brevibacillus centrosporus]RNB67622.1 proline/glycine betaine ABC transporter permease [Brevibacillus centrosporus]SFK56821.1 glycine betaine/proline transpo
MSQLFPKLPLDEWIEVIVDGLDENLGFVFDLISAAIGGTVDLFNAILTGLPFWLVIILFVLMAYRAGRWTMALFTFIGLLLIQNLGYWEHSMETLALVLTAALISVVIGIPMGIWCAKNESVQKVVTPLLDFMQTMPAFVYLIPAIFFFGLGKVPGVIASVIFAMPPTIRLTNLGIRQVPADLIEASDAFGSTYWQKLTKVQLPIAKTTMMAGINQSIMLALSMVVIASMIGAKGLGADVYRAVTQINIGQGFEAGLAIVIMAILLDRITQGVGKRKNA